MIQEHSEKLYSKINALTVDSVLEAIKKEDLSYCLEKYKKEVYQTVIDIFKCESGFDGWIPCKETLPSERKAVQILKYNEYDNGAILDVDSGWYICSKWISHDDIVEDQVLAWKPFGKAPMNYKEML